MGLVLQTYALTKHFGPVRAMDTAHVFAVTVPLMYNLQEVLI